MFDNTCKFLAENFPADFASWILGEPIPLTTLEPSELSLEPIRADSLIFLESTEVILHLEFQTRTDENMPFRMLDYWVRLYRKFPNRRIHQTVIYLKPTNSPLVYQTSFTAKQISFQFNVIRLWEQPTSIFQQYLGLLPFVALSKTDNPEESLRQAAQQIEAITDKRIQGNLASAACIISGLALEVEIIQRLFRREIMKDSVTYQAILLEGKAEGEILGKLKAVPRFLALGLGVEQIAEELELDVQLVRQVAAGKGENPNN